MRFYRGRAFASNEKILECEVIGNPATIVICEENFPSQEEMGRIAIEENQPMTTFIKQNKENEFDVEYFAPNGERFNICGHATIVAAHFIKTLYDYTDIIFRLFDYCEELPSEFISSKVGDDGIIKIDMPAYIPELVKKEDLISNYLKPFHLNKNDVENCYYCEELKDLIIVLKDEDRNKIREIKPDLKLLSEVAKKDNVRGIFITSKSNNENIDYEIRIFAPHLGIDEDISCCSANCSLLPLWNKILKITGIKESQILCPYNNTANAKFGGLEIGSYNRKEGRVSIGGLVKE